MNSLSNSSLLKRYPDLYDLSTGSAPTVQEKIPKKLTYSLSEK